MDNDMLELYSLYVQELSTLWGKVMKINLILLTSWI